MTTLTQQEIERIELLSTLGCHRCGKAFGCGQGSIVNVVWQRAPEIAEGFRVYHAPCGDEARREYDRAKAT